MRLSCAQTAAERQTVSDLLRAIALVNELRPDHPLRPTINQKIEEWALEILELSEQEFQAGRLSAAIASARKIPADTSAYRLVRENINRWTSIWAKGEKIYHTAEEELRNQRWHQAFRQAVRLLSIGNTHWETTKYRELTQNIREAREGGAKLAKAHDLADQGGETNLLKAIAIANAIAPDSYLHREARRSVAKFGRKFLKLAQAVADDGDPQEAIALVRKLPASIGLAEEVDDFIRLARAQSQAQLGGVGDLQLAINQAQKISPSRPSYGRAQQLATRWQLEIEDVGYLDQARALAAPGSMTDLMAAIAVAEKIPYSNPRGQEAQREVKRWTVQIQTMEDQPYLSQAEQLAIPGDVASLQAAIDQAQRIGRGRALYDDAQNRIQSWKSQMQKIQDQPFLDRATDLANNGNLPEAIATAQLIQPGRTLYKDAQRNISNWQDNLTAQKNLREAYSLSVPQTPEALSLAIQAANRIPASSPERTEADSLINQWSQQILASAQSQAQFNLLERAIAIAEKVPPRTEAYAEAQLLIQDWKKRLNSNSGLFPQNQQIQIR